MQDRPLETFSIQAATSHPLTSGGYLLTGSPIKVAPPFPPERYLQHGWQSWGLSGWVPIRRPLPIPGPSIMHPMRLDPAFAHQRTPNGAWYGAVEAPSGEVVFLGALDLGAHVEVRGSLLVGSAEQGQGTWFCAAGSQAEVLARYAGLLAERLGQAHLQRPPRIWCSWYSLYTAIDAERLNKILEDLGDLPFEVFQVDDGWQRAIGDWQPNEKFPAGMEALASLIRATGRKAGLWLAPLLVVPSAPLFREHPDWLLRGRGGGLVPAGFNWGQPCYALDTTHPAVLEWLAALMKAVRAWGYDYAKLDFLYAGALPGKRHQDLPREAAYRQGLKVMREALGDAYLLTCGAPILPSLGLCDGLRIGPDVAPYWISSRESRLLMDFAAPGVQNALRTCLHRLWLKPLVNTDPDVFYFRTLQNGLSPDQKALLQDLAQIAGFKATSDPPSWLTAQERQAMKMYLEANPAIEQISPTCYRIDGRRVDFDPYLPFPQPSALDRVLGTVFDILANIPLLLRTLDRIERGSLRKSLARIP